MAEVRLCADEMLGRLATWLRVLGLDTILLRPRLSRAEKRLKASGRVFLTRTKGFQIGRTIFIQADQPAEQLAEVVSALGLDPASLKPLSRCLICNVRLDRISNEEAQAFVPDYIAATQTSFQRCPSCQRVYWPGTHQQRMMARLSLLLGRS